MTEDVPRRSAPRHDDPARPDFAVGLPMRPEIPRPKVLGLAIVLVVLAGLAFIPYTAKAIARRNQIREKLEEQLAERSPNYSAADVEMAVLITLIGAAVLSVLFILAEFRSVRQLRRKIRGGRTWLLILTGFHLPLIAMSPYLRVGGREDIISAGVQGVCLTFATLIAFSPPVSRWLKAITRQGPIPLRTSAERQS